MHSTRPPVCAAHASRLCVYARTFLSLPLSYPSLAVSALVFSPLTLNASRYMRSFLSRHGPMTASTRVLDRNHALAFVLRPAQHLAVHAPLHLRYTLPSSTARLPGSHTPRSPVGDWAPRAVTLMRSRDRVSVTVDVIVARTHAPSSPISPRVSDPALDVCACTRVRAALQCAVPAVPLDRTRIRLGATRSTSRTRRSNACVLLPSSSPPLLRICP